MFEVEKEITLNDFLNTCDYHVTNGSKFLWECYGENTRVMSVETEYGAAECVFDFKTLMLYEISVHDKMKRLQCYRWIDKNFKQAYHGECKARNIDPCIFIDDIKQIETDTPDDILYKTYAILHNRSFEPDPVMVFDLEDESLKILEDYAKKENITLDEAMIKAIKNSIKKEKKRKK